MARKAILKYNNEVIYPRTSLDNVVAITGSTTTVSVPVLDANGKIDPSYLPSYVDDVVELNNITASAPSTAAKDDKYFNSTSNKIFTATASNTWSSTGADPETGKIYVNLTDNKTYRWSGSTMVEISKQTATVTSIRPVSSATDTVVPTELAVANALSSVTTNGHTHSISDVSGLQTALDGKQGTLTPGTGINLSNGGISIAASVSGTSASLGGVIINETASNGVKLANSSGTVSVSVNKATDAGGFGTVTVGTNISVSNGTISVAGASTQAPGVVQLEGNISSATGDALNRPPTTDAVKAYVGAQILAGVTCELIND